MKSKYFSALRLLLVLVALIGFSTVKAQGFLFTPTSTVNFTNTAPGSVSPEQIVTIQYFGPPTLITVTVIPPTNPAFTVTNSTCSSGLTLDFAQCVVHLTFTAPNTAGNVNDVYQFVTSEFGSQNIALNGSSVGAPPLTPQAITFTSTAPTNAVVGGATYDVTATGGGSSNPVVFSIDPSAASICSISGSSTVSFLAPGNCVVNADQAGDASYEPAPQAQQSFAVSPAPLTPQSITFTSTPPSPATVGGTYEVAATGGTSGEPVTFSIDPAASAVCSITGSTVSFLSEGNCVINANQAGNTTHEPAAQAAQSFSISPATVTPSAATPVPTLNQWGLMLLASLLGSLAFWRQRRKS